MRLSKGFLTKAFSTVSNIGIIAGLKAAGAIAVTANPVSLGAVATIGATALTSGILVAGYKTWKDGETRKDFIKSTLTHTGFGLLGGGVGFFADDIWDWAKTFPVVSNAPQTLSTLFSNAVSWMFNEDTIQSSREYLTRDFTGTLTETSFNVDGRLFINTPENSPNISLVLNPDQSEIMARSLCAELSGCEWTNTEMTVIPTEPTLSYSDRFILDLTQQTDCDNICANNSSTMVCANFNTDAPPIAITFDMEGGAEILGKFCSETNLCDYDAPTTMPTDEVVTDIILNEPIIDEVIINTPEPTPPIIEPEDIPSPLPVYIVQSGDNLWRIAERIYGDGSKYTLILQANLNAYPGLVNADWIYPNMELVIPESDAIAADCDVIHGSTFCRAAPSPAMA